NYRAYQEGPVTFRYILWPHGNFNAGKNSELAIGYSQPLIVKAASEESLVSGGITPDNPAVIVTTIKPADDGKDIMLVLFNSSASDVTTRLKSAKSIGIFT
ncbi:MAG: hypothetical protein HC905_31820, partial [Bacteroidales bacterium]|nr:hypothetical protein [Bacteroidales bacterium]